jgi:16S rRNA G966 N2-methylase RsmD
VIFLDPPYKTDYIEKSIIKITKNNLLSEDGIIICESDNLNKIIYPNNYKSVKEKKYGDKSIVILKKI